MLSANSVPDVLREKFKSFPAEMCEFGSNLLGRYLGESGIENVRYVCGTRTTDKWDERHVWLDAQGFTVDITADQFPDGPGPVVVAKDSPWHRRFRVLECRAAANLNGYCKGAREEYDCVYRVILKNISVGQAFKA